jgi:molybdate transport system substrate-binding protein
MARSELDALGRKGVVIEGSRVDLVGSRIGMAVRAGAAVPDISTVAHQQGVRDAIHGPSATGAYLCS